MADSASPPTRLISTSTKTTCPYCGVGCGVMATRDAAGTVTVAGDSSHPSNFGRLCVKGSALDETVGPEGRLLYPQVRGQRVAWDAALTTVAQGFAKIMAEHGPESVALYVSGQLLTEDYYLANKLVKGYFGTANIDTNSRLCMSSAVAGHKRAFGEDIVPVSYDDLELADLIVLVGSNTAWCHPILFQRIVKAKEARPEMKLVVIDPRRTATTELADLHLPICAGSDVSLFNGLLSFLHQHGVVDARFVASHTNGLATAMAVADNTAGNLRSVAHACRIEKSALAEFYRLFARTQKVITAFSMGVNQSSSGTDKVNSIINCHLLSGRIGKAGAGPFSITGQPNAMGGREVGGLANMLAAHMDLDKPEHRALVQTFWQSPRIAEKPGLKAVDLFDAMHAGRIKAVWIMATNPVVSLPDADRVKAALTKCELVVVSDVMATTDTTAFAHVLLPALAWGEKDGTVTNSERRISRQRAFIPPAGEAKADWWAIAEVAKRMGYSGFEHTDVHEVFDEHARLSAFENREMGDGRPEALTGSQPVLRAFNIGGLVGLGKVRFDDLQPVRWPILAVDASPFTPDPSRPFSDGKYFHPDRKARFIATPPRAPANPRNDAYPLILNTGRVRDHWHTMTRTGLSPKLGGHVSEPYVDLHPQDALGSGVREGELARVASRWGAMVARVRCSGEVPRRSVFVPIHWNGQFASDARVGSLVNPVVDPISGEPEFKHTPVCVEPFTVRWHGFALSRKPLPMGSLTWWTRITGRGFTRYEIAGRDAESNWQQRARSLLGVADTEADWLEYEDLGAGSYRVAHVVDDRIESCLFVSPRPEITPRAWLSGLFEQTLLSEQDRVGLLVGEPLLPQADTGVTICSCFGIGRNTITNAIRLHDLKTTQDVTACVKAGGNCGSCVPELKKLIAECSITVGG